jgi:MFS family permease
MNSKSPVTVDNVRYFIAFRAFFNARFYYPVFTILFLDFGLSLSQFAILNVAWAATIVLLEVPSGALADTIGRRNLLIGAGILMVVEMALLCIVPRGNVNLLFAVFLLNRILSGAAEAAASGADEALAYDALKAQGDITQWPRVLELQIRIQSLAYIAAMSIGAAVYDPVLMQKIANLIHLDLTVTQDLTLRFPLYLTLIMSVGTVIITLKMRDVEPSSIDECQRAGKCAPTVSQAMRLTWLAGFWILRTPFALVIILAGMLFDHVLRMIITLISQYYRLIELPEACFGLIGSGMAILGLIIPRIARRQVSRHSPSFNLFMMAGLTLLGITGMTFFWPIFGLLPVICLVSVMYFGRFFVSHYLNQITASQQRATVLSFKGLSYNLAYGLIGILYSMLLAGIRPYVALETSSDDAAVIEGLVFIKSIGWFPWYFAATFLVLLLIAHWQLNPIERQAKSKKSSNNSNN